MNFKSTVMALSCLTMASSSLQAVPSLPTLTPTNAFPYVLSKLSGNVVQLQGSYTNVVNQYVVVNNYYNECNNTVVTALANITATLDSITIPVSAGNSSGSDSGSSGGGIGAITATLAALQDVIGSLDIEITDVWAILQGADVTGFAYNRNSSLASGVQNLTDAGHALTVQVNNGDSALSIIASDTSQAYGYTFNSTSGPDHISNNINSLVSQLINNWGNSNTSFTGEINACNAGLASSNGQISNAESMLTYFANFVPQTYGYSYNSTADENHISGNINQLMTSVLDNWTSSNATFTGALNDCNEQGDAYQATIVDLTSSLASANANLTTCETLLSADDATLTELYSNLTSTSAALGSCNAETASAYTTLSGYNGQSGYEYSSGNTLSSNIGSLYGALSTALVDQTNLVNSYISDLAACNTNLTSITLNYNDCVSSHAGDAGALSFCQSELSNCNTYNNGLQSQINSLEEQLSGCQSNYDTCSSDLGSLQSLYDSCTAGCGGGGSGGEGCGYSTRDIAVPLVNSAISWQQSLLSAFEETTGVTVVPQAVNYLIDYIKGNTSSTIKQAGLDMGVADFSTVNGVASNGLIDDLTTLISNALGDFIRYEWSQATHTFNATSFYSAIDLKLSWYASDYNDQFFQVLPSNITNHNQTMHFDPIGFTGLSVGIQNTTILQSELEIALENWAASAEFPLTEADTTSFVNAIIGSPSIRNGNQSTVLGVINTWVNSTASSGLSAFIQEKDFSSTLTSTVDTLVETFNTASKVYVLPQELRTYMANLQVAIADAEDIAGEADFVTNAYDIATRTAQSQNLNTVYDDAQLPYLATNITQMFTQAIQVVWENNVKPYFTPSNWDSEAVADAVFVSSGALHDYQEQAISSGIQNWFTAMNGTFTSSGEGYNSTLNADITSMITAYKALTSTANIIPPETLSPVNVVDLTTSMETTLGSLYAKIKSLQLKLASFQGQIVDFTSL